MHQFEIILVIGLILFGFSSLQYFAKKTFLPYTVLLLLFGFFSQELMHFLGFKIILHLPSEAIYYFLLPILLFGSAMHLNLHQFKLQFKTVSFLATFGLLLAVAFVTVSLALVLGIDWGAALLFGSLISATDPIAVLALFKSLGGPKRLALIADGESMFNDATAVVVFRIVATVVVGGNSFSHMTALGSLAEFFYVFIGSILVGAFLGYLASSILAKIENDAEVETTLTLSTALLVFTATEHYLHLSGVITAVVSGLVIGNLGKARISPQVAHFVHSFWEYLGYLAVSIVFFFTTYNLDTTFLIKDFPRWLWVVLIVLLSRAFSVYLSIAISNHSRFFRDEPNIPFAWQHVLNWGGIRGVIPLVLVFSLPETYQYRDEIFIFTFATLLFTLFVNGSTVAWLLKKLKLNCSSGTEDVDLVCGQLFDLETAIRRLKQNRPVGVSPATCQRQIAEWQEIEQVLIKQLNKFARLGLLKQSLQNQAFNIERGVYEKMLERSEISEAVFFDLDAQLDLQLDALEHPEIFVRGVDKKGRINTRKLFRQKLFALRQLAFSFKPARKLFKLQESELLLERYSLLRARLSGNERVSRYFEYLSSILLGKNSKLCLDKLKQEYQSYFANGLQELKELKVNGYYKDYEKRLLSKALIHHYSPWVI